MAAYSTWRVSASAGVGVSNSIGPLIGVAATTSRLTASTQHTPGWRASATSPSRRGAPPGRVVSTWAQASTMPTVNHIR